MDNLIYLNVCILNLLFFFAGGHTQERTLVDELVAYNCDPNTEYNEVASLFLRDADTAIRQVRIYTSVWRAE